MNRLVGNPAGTPVFETAGGLCLVADRPVVVASTVDLAPRVVPAGQSIAVDATRTQVWHYLAVRGGLDVELVLGSASHDTLTGIGPAPLLAGERIPLGRRPAGPIVVDVAPVRARRSTVSVWPGPRADWFAPGTFEQLCAETWTTTTQFSRVGVRLAGAVLSRTRTDDLPSEGLVTGSIQVPADGAPVVMLPDHPTTGGYPVLAVVDPADVAVVAQHPPGLPLRFRPAR